MDTTEKVAEILAAAVERHHGRVGMNSEAILAAGRRGVELALARFDPAKGYTFEPWCTWWVEMEIARALPVGPWVPQPDDPPWSKATS